LQASRIAGLGLAVLTSAAANAQTSPAPAVTIYGLLDTGVEYISNVGAGHSRLVRMPGLTGALPSRLGFRGSEDLGGGLRAMLTLETGIGLDTGSLNQGGRMFGRQAWVGLASNWGSVSLGRTYSMLFWSLLDSDQLGPNVFSLGSFDSYLPNSRADNSIAYLGTFSGLTVGANYSLGRDAVNAGPSPAGTNCAGENAADKQACRQWSAMVKYDTPTWGAALAADEFHGGTGAFAGLVRSDLTDRRVTLNGYVKFGDGIKLTAGVIRRDNQGAALASATNGATAKSDLYWIGGAWSPPGLVTVDGQVQQLAFKNGGDKSTLTAVRAFYHLSPRTSAYAQVGHISNGSRLAFSVSSGQPGSNLVAGGSQNAAMVGLRHTF